MKNTFLSLIILLLFSTHISAQLTIDGQTIIYLGAIETVIVGDGRTLYIDRDGEALNGLYRIIDNRNKDQYNIVEFRDGLMYDTCLYFKGTSHYRDMIYDKGMGKMRIDYYTDGSIYETAELADGAVNGMVKRYSPDGKLIYEKKYKDGYKDDGIERHYNPETGKIETDIYYLDGIPHGSWVEKTDKANDNENRVWELRDDEKAYYIRKSVYDNGKVIGNVTEVYTDGTIRSEKPRNKNNEPHGRWFTVRPDGRLVDESIYENGVALSEKVYKPSGQLHSESYTDGEKKTSTEYNSDGSLGKIREYIDGVIKVRKEYYFGQNQLKAEYNFTQRLKTDLQQGTYTMYYENGKVKEEGRIERGREVYKREYYTNGQLKSVLDYDGRWRMIEAYNENGEQLSDVYIHSL